MQYFKLITLTLLVVIGDNVMKAHYREKALKWMEEYVQCAGPQNSPINIDTSSTFVANNLKPIRFSRMPPIVKNLTLVNTGKSVELQLKLTNASDEEKLYLILDEKEKEQWRVAGIHFHWGKEDEDIMEHTINNGKDALESHIVTFNEKYYKNINEAINSPLGLAVVGTLFKVGEKSEVFEKVLKSMDENPDVYYYNNKTKIMVDEIDLSNFMPKDWSRYYRYMGSLTTPPCAQSVLWTVMADLSNNIHTDQLKKLRMLRDEDEHLIVENGRPRVPVNNMDRSDMYWRTVLYAPGENHFCLNKIGQMNVCKFFSHLFQAVP